MRFEFAIRLLMCGLPVLLALADLGNCDAPQEADQAARSEQGNELQQILPPSAQLQGNSEYQRYEIVLTLDEEKLQQIQKTGFLKASLPAQYLNRVDSIVLKSTTSFVDEKYQLTLDVDKRNQALWAEIDQSVLEHLPFQPVQIKVYDSNFSAILLRFLPGNTLIEDQASAVDQKFDGGPVWLHLKNGKRLPGYLKDGQVMRVKTQIGDLPIPFNSFDGIAFPENPSGDDLTIAEDGNQVVILANSDQITGTLDLATIVLKTRWGDKSFSRGEVEAITRSRQTVLQPPADASQTNWSVKRN
jgi:hypothetical protein